MLDQFSAVKTKTKTKTMTMTKTKTLIETTRCHIKIAGPANAMLSSAPPPIHSFTHLDFHQNAAHFNELLMK